MKSWRESLAIYAHPEVRVMLFLGYSAGLPFLLVFSTLTAWLAQSGIEKATISYFGWVGITYSIKMFWAPVVDRLPLPWLTRHFGRRRSWMMLAQCGIAAGLIGLALAEPAHHLTQVAVLAVLVAFSAATQDITIDAYRIEAAPQEMQGAMAAAYQLGYRVALICAGAGALFIAAGYGWKAAYLAMAALVAVGFITALVIAEPAASINGKTAAQEQRVIDFLERSAHWPDWMRSSAAWFIGAVVCPFVDFFTRNGVQKAALILLFISLFRITDIAMGVMANPFYLDIGYSLEQIASIAKGLGVAMTIAGAAAGGVVVARYGIPAALIASGVLVILSNLCFATLAGHAPTLAGLAAVISADSLSGGLAGTAFIAYLSGLTNTAYTATQYALFSSLMTLPGKFLSGYSGTVVDTVGWPLFFVYTSTLGLPALLLVLWLTRRVSPPTNSARLPESAGSGR